MTKYLELAKKLKALAEGGEQNEKQNAQKILEIIMLKHGITMEDIEGEVRSYHHFAYSDDTHRKLLVQVASVVLDREDFDIYKCKRKKELVFEISHAEAVEIQAKYDFYARCYKQELDIFYLAFVSKNNLYAKSQTKICSDELTEQELEQFKKMKQMREGLDEHLYHKQLQSK